LYFWIFAISSPFVECELEPYHMAAPASRVQARRWHGPDGDATGGAGGVEAGAHDGDALAGVGGEGGCHRLRESDRAAVMALRAFGTIRPAYSGSPLFILPLGLLADFLPHHLGQWHARDLAERRIDVHGANHFIAETGTEPFWPGNDHGHADSAFVECVFSAAKRGVLCVGHEGSAVVVNEEDHRVFQQLLATQFVEHPTDFAIEEMELPEIVSPDLRMSGMIDFFAPPIERLLLWIMVVEALEPVFFKVFPRQLMGEVVDGIEAEVQVERPVAMGADESPRLFAEEFGGKAFDVLLLPASRSMFGVRTSLLRPMYDKSA
jgi:hypothetical protein